MAKKWITLLVMIAFFWTLQLSAAPKPSTSSNSSYGAAGADDEDAGGAVERSGKYAPAKKKSSIVPIVIGVLVAGAVVAILVLVVFKTKYDITGTWMMPMIQTTPSSSNWTAICTFTGDKKSGVFTYTDPGLDENGTYTVDKKNVSFSFSFSAVTVTFTGKFDEKEKMSGTWQTTTGFSGTWTATKGATASMPPVGKTQGKSLLLRD